MFMGQSNNQPSEGQGDSVQTEPCCLEMVEFQKWKVTGDKLGEAHKERIARWGRKHSGSLYMCAGTISHWNPPNWREGTPKTSHRSN